MSKSKSQRAVGMAGNAMHVEKAPAYFTSSGTKNWEPALLVLMILVIGLNSVRAGALPNLQESVIWLVLCGLVVLAGAFVPGVVALALVGLLIAGALNANNKLVGMLDSFTEKVGKLNSAQPTA